LALIGGLRHCGSHGSLLALAGPGTVSLARPAPSDQDDHCPLLAPTGRVRSSDHQRTRDLRTRDRRATRLETALASRSVADRRRPPRRAALVEEARYSLAALRVA